MGNSPSEVPSRRNFSPFIGQISFGIWGHNLTPVIPLGQISFGIISPVLGVYTSCWIYRQYYQIFASIGIYINFQFVLILWNNYELQILKAVQIKNYMLKYGVTQVAVSPVCVKRY